MSDSCEEVLDERGAVVQVDDLSSSMRLSLLSSSMSIVFAEVVLAELLSSSSG